MKLAEGVDLDRAGKPGVGGSWTYVFMSLAASSMRLVGELGELKTQGVRSDIQHRLNHQTRGDKGGETIPRGSSTHRRPSPEALSSSLVPGGQTQQEAEPSVSHAPRRLPTGKKETKGQKLALTP